MQKIINAIACLTFLLTLGSIGSAYFGYKYITSPKGQEKIKKQINAPASQTLKFEEPDSKTTSPKIAKKIVIIPT